MDTIARDQTPTGLAQQQWERSMQKQRDHR
jgi:hypothetical protein